MTTQISAHIQIEENMRLEAFALVVATLRVHFTTPHVIRGLAEEVEGHFLVNDLRPLPDLPVSEDPPSLTEVRRAISKLKSGKAAGICGIPADPLKAGGEPMTRGLHRPEQSGFTPGKSSIDRILALRLIIERRREFGRGLLAAYIDLKKAFDSESGITLGYPETERNSNKDYWTNIKPVPCHCGATPGNIKITVLDFANGVAILSVFGNPRGGS
ncbi:uncharacterized protein [Penaeus vannamei]|uniref:uncharacterized protein n=1 Tax=Penaeus vannamei TaxID=6689 RepID=UPI00387FA574